MRKGRHDKVKTAVRPVRVRNPRLEKGPPPTRARGSALTVVAMCVLGAAAIGFLVYAAVTSGTWRLRAYTVKGASYLTPAEVLAASGLKDDDNLFTLDAAGVRERLLAHPRIRTARVERRLPGEVVITISERPAAAVLVINGEFYKVAADGIILGPLAAGYEDLPVLVGPAYTARGAIAGKRFGRAEVGEALAVLTAIGNVDPVWLAAMDYVDINARTLVLARGARRVRYGAGFDERTARRLWRVYAETAMLTNHELIYDVRYGNDVVVKGLAAAAGSPPGGDPRNGGAI